MDVTALQRHVAASEIQPENLAGNSHLSKSEKIAEASRQFESILLKQILQSSQKTVIKSKYSDESSSSSIYHDMVTNQLADSISKSGGLGLAKTFESQLDRPEKKALAAQDPETIAAMSAPHGNFTVEGPKNHTKVVHYSEPDAAKSSQHVKHTYAKRP